MAAMERHNLGCKLILEKTGPSTDMNLIKIRVLFALSKTCSPSVLSSIIDQNPFLLDETYIRELSSDNNANVQEAQELIKMFLLQEQDKYFFSSSETKDEVRTLQCVLQGTPLYVATSKLNSEDLYRTVKLLITCGANVNVKCAVLNRTPLCALLYHKDMANETLRFMLENGKNAVKALKHEFNNQGLDIVMKNSETPENMLEKMKLCLEFGVITDENTLLQKMRKLNGNDEDTLLPYMRNLNRNIICATEIVKLLMEYLVLKRLKRAQSKVNRSLSAQRYDKLFDLRCFGSTLNYEELDDYRKNLIKELNAMMNDKLDENNTLFSFLSDRCPMSRTCVENEETLVHKVLSKLYHKRYFCCDDLFCTSMKKSALLSNLQKLHIFAIKPSKKKIVLNSDIVLYLSLYLAKSDIINLTLAFWTEVSGHSEDHLSTNDSFNSNFIFPPTKRMRI